MRSSTGHLDLLPARLCRRGKHGTLVGLGKGPGPAVPTYCLVTDHEVAVGWAHPVSAGMAARPGLGSQDANLVPCSARPRHPAMGAMTAGGQIDGVQ